MSKISKFVKVDKNVLLEYVYNDGNIISDSYNILVNSKDKTSSYVAGDSSATGNTVGNQLFKIDSVSLKYGKVDTGNYTFLQLKNFAAGTPIRHDILKLHLPINWTFGEYLGLYVRLYTYDTLNFKTYDISNFYFDMTDLGQQYLMNFNSPPILFQEKLWGKNISIEVPAISEISSQLSNNLPRENSINANLTGGTGLSMTSPIFIDFHFIDNIQTINGVTTYRLTPKVTTSFAQTPEFEKLGLMVSHSPNGDFFEIYGTYNETLAGFNQFIEDSFNQGNRYYVQYSITLYEQNRRGKTVTITMNDNFNESIEYRPIIKTSTTTAIIDVEMKLIDNVDESYIIRRASYGMLQDEVAKYSLMLMKINLKNATKPKIYNVRNLIDPLALGYSNAQGKMLARGAAGGVLNALGIPTGMMGLPGMNGMAGGGGLLGPNNLSNLNVNQGSFLGGVGAGGAGAGGLGAGGLGAGGLGAGGLGAGGLGAGLDGGLGAGGLGAGAGAGGIGGVGFAGAGLTDAAAAAANGGIQPVKVPFPVLVDRYNIIGKSENALYNSLIYYGITKMTIVLYPFDNIVKFVVATGDVNAPNILDMSGFGEIKLVFKNDTDNAEFNLYTETNEVDTSVGQLVFKVAQSKFQTIKKIFDSKINLYYITSTNQNVTSVVYTGLFKIFDNQANVTDMNNQAAANNPGIIKDPKLPRETATVTRQLVQKPGGKGTAGGGA